MTGEIIFRAIKTLEQITIPDGYHKCPDCQGYGEVVRIYKDPGPNEYMVCLTCNGKGFVPNKNSKTVLTQPIK